MRQDAREQRPWPRNAGFAGRCLNLETRIPQIQVGRARVEVEVPQVYYVQREGKGVDGDVGLVVGGDGCGLVS
jgi:hypothetical protein